MRKDDAEHAIRRALHVLWRGSATVDQMSDVADAIEAFHDRTFGVAHQLATAAINPRRRIDLNARRPGAETLTFGMLHERFQSARERQGARGVENARRDGSESETFDDT